MANKAIFKINDPGNWDSTIREYEVEYIDAIHLQELFQEARKVWDEYDVVVDCGSFIMSHSHTYKEQVMKELMIG